MKVEIPGNTEIEFHLKEYDKYKVGEFQTIFEKFKKNYEKYRKYLQFDGIFIRKRIGFDEDHIKFNEKT